MPNFLFHIDVEGAEDAEHIAKIATGFLDELERVKLHVSSATMTSHTNFGHPATVNLKSAPTAVAAASSASASVAPSVIVPPPPPPEDEPEDEEKEEKHGHAKAHAKKR
jgi:hypothetical protein